MPFDPVEDYDRRMRAIVAARRERDGSQKVEDENDAGEIEISNDEWVS
jgi:hypothetical protein